MQRRSFDWFKGEGLSALFREMFPVEDDSGNFKVSFVEHKLGKPSCTQRNARESGGCYSAPLFVTILVMNEAANEGLEQPVFVCDLPLMTGKGTFIYWGREVIVANHLVPAPGVYFDCEYDEDGDVYTCSAEIVPIRGAWLEIDIDEWDTMGVRFNRGRRLPVETLLRAIGCDQLELSKLFHGTTFYDLALAEDHYPANDESLFEVFRRVRSGESKAVPDRSTCESLFCNKRLYDLSASGRQSLNKKLGLSIDGDNMTLTRDDILKCINYLVCLNSNLPGFEVDHDLEQLDSYVVLTAGELLLEQIRVGLCKMQQQFLKNVTATQWGSVTPQTLTDIRPLVMAVRDLFEFGMVADEAGGLTVLADRSDEWPLCAVPHGSCEDDAAIVVLPIAWSDALNLN